jgi:hypothetical protein
MFSKTAGQGPGGAIDCSDEQAVLSAVCGLQGCEAVRTRTSQNLTREAFGTSLEPFLAAPGFIVEAKR